MDSGSNESFMTGGSDGTRESEGRLTRSGTSDRVVRGVEKDPLTNADLVAAGEKAEKEGRIG